MPKTSYRTSKFGESVIRGMTRLANECGAINLSQGYPDFDPPEVVLQAAERAEISLRVNERFNPGGADRADQLVLQVLDADVEAQSLHVGPRGSEGSRQSVSHNEAVARELDRRFDQTPPRELSAIAPREMQPGDGPRNADG